MEFVLRIKRGMTQVLVVILILLMAVLTLDVLWGVFSRFVLRDQSSWTEELARMLLIWVVLLGASLAFSEKAHLGLDYMVEKLDAQARRLAAVVAHLLVLAFAVAVLCVGGWQLVAKTLQMEQMMMALGIPKGWIYLALPISGLFIAIFSIESIVLTLMRSEGCDRDGKGTTDV